MNIFPEVKKNFGFGCMRMKMNGAEVDYDEFRAMIDAFRPKVYALIRYLDTFLNEDGLLEKLPAWVFVEWSRANQLGQDVNYPSNMLYAAALEVCGELYGDAAMGKRAADIRKTVLEQSFDGEFFLDNALRKDGKLVLSGEKTEVCQYYAFWCNVATPESHGDLWQKLLYDFGPQRKENNAYPDVHFANAFIGNYLRLDLLYRYGYRDLVLKNIEGYFTKMADLTGTLWEHDGTSASVDHGFASHVVCWLDGE
jgi:alpha-L-rhamnosidase